jgi:hypothetical protein
VELEPGIGAHTEEVLAEWLGIDGAVVDVLRKGDAVG